MMHPMPVYCTVLAFVGSVSSVGGSPHRHLFFCWWTGEVFWSPCCIWSLKRQIYITGHTFLKLRVCIPCGTPPFVVSPQWLICPPAKNKTKHGIFRKHAAQPPFVLLLLINSTTFLLWCGNVWILLHIYMFVFSLICIKAGGYTMGGNMPPLFTEEGAWCGGRREVDHLICPLWKEETIDLTVPQAL